MYPEKHRGALRAPQLRAARARSGLARPPGTARRDNTAAAAACGSGLDGLLELGAGAEPRRLRRLDGHGLTGGRVDAPARGAVRDRELAEAGDVDLRPGGERLLDGLQGRVEHAPGLGSRYPGAFGDLSGQLGLVHSQLPSSADIPRRILQVAPDGPSSTRSCVGRGPMPGGAVGATPSPGPNA